MLGGRELDVPDTTSMAFKSLFERQGASLPDVDGLVLRRSGHKFIIRRDPNSINVLLVSHDSHLRRIDDRGALYILLDISCAPNFQGIILAH